MFILAQISGFLAWLCLLISYYRKNTNKILVLHIFSIVFYLLNYLFLGAWAGLFIIILELLRDFLYYKTDKDNFIFTMTLPIYIILFILYRNSIIELIPIIASVFEGFTLTKKKNTVVIGALIVYSMWVVYDINVNAYTGALTDGLIVISNIGILINIIRGYKKIDKFKISSRYSLTKISINKLNELKKDVFAKELLLSNSYEEKLYNKNKNSLLFIKYNNELKGYITTIAITKNTLNKIMNIDEIKDDYENIILNSNLNGKLLLIDSIVLKEKYQNKKSKDLIIKHISKLIKDKKYNNVIILGSNDFEKEIAKSFKFNKLKELSSNSIIYTKINLI